MQDVYAALKEIELSGIMDLGTIGTDGRAGGRLEREVAVFEEGVMRKRKGYREKVKARESTGAGGEDEERGEPSSKKVRRMSEHEEDEEERMLERQLNGGVDHDGTHKEQDGGPDPNANGVSVVVANGHSKGKEKADPHSDAEDEDEDEGPDSADEAEDDNPVDDEEGSNPDDAAVDNEDTEEEVDDEHAAEMEEFDGYMDSLNRGDRGLLPNGEVEENSDEQSD